MSRSRNCEHSRKEITEVRAHELRQVLITRASQETVDRVPIDLHLSAKSQSSINIFDGRKRLKILLTGETAHAMIVS